MGDGVECGVKQLSSAGVSAVIDRQWGMAAEVQLTVNVFNITGEGYGWAMGCLRMYRLPGGYYRQQYGTHMHQITGTWSFSISDRCVRRQGDTHAYLLAAHNRGHYYPSVRNCPVPRLSNPHFCIHWNLKGECFLTQLLNIVTRAVAPLPHCHVST